VCVLLLLPLRRRPHWLSFASGRDSYDRRPDAYGAPPAHAPYGRDDRRGYDDRSGGYGGYDRSRGYDDRSRDYPASSGYDRAAVPPPAAGGVPPPSASYRDDAYRSSSSSRHAPAAPGYDRRSPPRDAPRERSRSRERRV